MGTFDWQPMATIPIDRLILVRFCPIDIIAGVKPITNQDGSTAYVTRRGNEIDLAGCAGWIAPENFPDTPEAADFPL